MLSKRVKYHQNKDPHSLASLKDKLHLQNEKEIQILTTYQ
jgi:hypothetical protein